MNKTAIEWATMSWNPVTGCSKVSPGCAHCYAEGLSLRRGWSALPWLPEHAGENVLLHTDRLREPLARRAPERIFVCSMADLFHELVPFAYVDAVVEVMAAAARHTFLVLTKRPERIHEFLAWQAARAGRQGFSANVWAGTSIENRRFTDRADQLRTLPCAVRFISAEPLLGPLIPYGSSGDGYLWHGRDAGTWEVLDDPGLDLTGIDQVIVGGESGPGHRPIEQEWVTDLRDRCVDEGVAFFLKQWGGHRAKDGGRLLEGRTWDELPAPAVGAGQGQLELEAAAA